LVPRLSAHVEREDAHMPDEQSLDAVSWNDESRRWGGQTTTFLQVGYAAPFERRGPA
jgi:hypothetical protein